MLTRLSAAVALAEASGARYDVCTVFVGAATTAAVFATLAAALVHQSAVGEGA
jgi:hypothetical protein